MFNNDSKNVFPLKQLTNEQIAGRQIKTITLDHVSSEEAGLKGAELEMKEQYGHMALMVVNVEEDSPLCKQGKCFWKKVRDFMTLGELRFPE